MNISSDKSFCETESYVVSVKEREKAYHDTCSERMAPDSVPVKETFTFSTSPEPRWLLEQLGDLNKKKVFYQSNFGLNKADLHFETSLNLSEGFNQIFVFARDQHNILSSKELQIWRKGT